MHGLAPEELARERHDVLGPLAQRRGPQRQHLEPEVQVLAECALGSRSDTPHHIARTLVRTPGLRLMLLALEEGASLAEHRAEAPITLQVLEGRVRLACPGSTLELEAGTVITLDRDVAHALHAVTRRSVLLTIAWAGHRARGARVVAPAMQQLVA